jgi:hypothetical protein
VCVCLINVGWKDKAINQQVGGGALVSRYTVERERRKEGEIRPRLDVNVKMRKTRRSNDGG